MGESNDRSGTDRDASVPGLKKATGANVDLQFLSSCLMN